MLTDEKSEGPLPNILLGLGALNGFPEENNDVLNGCCNAGED